MQLSLQTFQQLLQRMSATVQNSAGQLIDLSAGSVLRAVLEANASIGLWIQWLIVQTLGMTRAATSTGSDLDSWMADFMLSRQPAVPARGMATFSRFLNSTPLNIPACTLVKAPGVNMAFSVDVDTNHPAWTPSPAGYLMPIGISTIELPIVAQTAGAAGNVTAGAISVIVSAVPGLDVVLNSSALSGGVDAESDDRFRTRFRDYINSRSQATSAAIGYAVTSLQQGMRYRQIENTDVNGAWQPGYFLVVADDGSGMPSASVLSNVYTAIDRVRPLGSNFTVRPPDVLPVAITISLTLGGTPISPAAQAQVVNAVTTYVGQLPIGPTLSVSRIVEVAYRAGQLTTNIAAVAINGLSSDLVCPSFTVLQVQSVTVQ